MFIAYYNYEKNMPKCAKTETYMNCVLTEKYERNGYKIKASTQLSRKKIM